MNIALTVVLAIGAFMVGSVAGPAPVQAAQTGTTVLSATSTADADYAIGRQHSGVGSSAFVSRATLSGGIVMTGKPSQPGANDAFTFEFTPAQGTTLHLGRYAIPFKPQGANDDDVRLAVGSTGLDLVGDVEVLDLAADAKGNVTRFDIVFRHGIDSPAGAFFGQIRMGQASDAGAVLGTTTIQYPTTPIGSVPIWVQQKVTNSSTSSVKVGSASVTSGAVTDFRISKNGCAGKTLSPGASCTFDVGFVPTKAGPRIGVVSVETGFGVKAFSVTGSAPLGTTSIKYSGDDSVSGGTVHSFPDGVNSIVVGGSPGNGWTFTPTRPYGLDDGADTTAVRLVKYDYDQIKPGTYETEDTISPAPGSSAKHGFAVTGSGRGCGDYAGRVKISSFDVDAAGTLQSAKLSWTLQCKFEPGVMTGSLQWRDRADKARPAAITGLRLSGSGASRTLTWKPSTSSDAVASVVRLVPGTGAASLPTSGLPVQTTGANTAVLSGLTTGKQYRVLVWSIDAAGNVGWSASLPIKG